MIQQSEPRIVLASASTTRRDLLSSAGLAFTVEAASVDEEAVKQSAIAENAEAEETAILLAELKAQRISRRLPEALVIGADQILVCDNRWFSKPADLSAARQHLLALRGRAHRLATAVVCCIGGDRIWHHVASPKLTMRDFSDQFLDGYLEQEQQAVLTSVGCYRLEGLGVQLFSQTGGEHSAILGLPLLPLLDFLRQRKILLS